jgi:uncharacterized DUF497 family protein
MDMEYEAQGITFVWDTAKAAANRRKHGVDFPRACEAFFDPFLRVKDAGVEEEPRDAVIGMDAVGALLFVVHLEVEGERFRIISARRSTPAERTFYEEQ